ncbi:MAG: hypothetical protein NT157_03875 [Candidatus Micrarchaeota archaeon]|nr:hypothetical protein [Candidatus Micrarchaeota archaeon]
MEGRVATGIPGLDELLGGGMKGHSVCLVAGASGTGKTTLGMQFLYEGANTYNEPGLLISFEEDKRQINDYFSSFSWDLGLLESKRKLVVLEYPAQEISHFMAQEVLIHDTISENGIIRARCSTSRRFATAYSTSTT